MFIQKILNHHTQKTPNLQSPFINQNKLDLICHTCYQLKTALHILKAIKSDKTRKSFQQKIHEWNLNSNKKSFCCLVLQSKKKSQNSKQEEWGNKEEIKNEKAYEKKRTFIAHDDDDVNGDIQKVPLS